MKYDLTWWGSQSCGALVVVESLITFGNHHHFGAFVVLDKVKFIRRNFFFRMKTTTYIL